MFEHVRPESVGVNEADIRRFLGKIVDRRINLHSVLMMRGDKLFYEKYFAPFTADMPHRLYSVTKSFVSIAIGFLEQEGKLKLSDPIVKFFPDKLPEYVDPLLEKQTIADMLSMRTCFAHGHWFQKGVYDRTKFYFDLKPDKAPDTVWHYDSCGSYILGALVERLSGMSLLDYLKSRVLDEIGGFENATILKSPDGVAWGDSAMVAKPLGLLAFARFCLNYGTWNGKRLLNEEYLKAATSYKTDNDVRDGYGYSNFGYGYKFWIDENGAFSMDGMGSQFAVCVPGKDLIFVCTGDTQGTSEIDNTFMFEAFFREIVDHVDGAQPKAHEIDLDAPLAMRVARGEKTSPFAEKVNGKKFVCRENAMGITEFTLTFDGDEGVFAYVNAQGKKELPFGLKKQWFGKFPQLGYSDERGNVHDETSDFKYDCAVSGGWIMEKMLQLRVQVIDRYFGMLIITIGFREDGDATVCMNKTAEDFFDEYQGWAIAHAE